MPSVANMSSLKRKRPRIEDEQWKDENSAQSSVGQEKDNSSFRVVDENSFHLDDQSESSEGQEEHTASKELTITEMEENSFVLYDVDHHSKNSPKSSDFVQSSIDYSDVHESDISEECRTRTSSSEGDLTFHQQDVDNNSSISALSEFPSVNIEISSNEILSQEIKQTSVLELSHVSISEGGTSTLNNFFCENLLEKEDIDCSVSDISLDDTNSAECETSLSSESDFEINSSLSDTGGRIEGVDRMGTDSDSNSDYDNDNIEPYDLMTKCSPLLHTGSKITVDEAVLQILNLYLKNKCSKSCLKDLISLVSSLLPSEHHIPRSSFQFLKNLKSLAPTCDEIPQFYCSDCLVHHGTASVSPCPGCNSNAVCGKFFEFDIEKMVRFYFEQSSLAYLLDREHISDQTGSVISDTRHGCAYKELNKDRNKYDLTLVLNTDGIKLKKSSVKDLWLLMAMPVEVPKHLRFKFIFILGVWYESNQPNMNTFLKPFCTKLKDIYSNGGISWKHPLSGDIYNSQIIAPLFVADAPARAKVQNITNHNGKYGCNTCEVRTVRSNPIPGKRRVRVYAGHYNSPLRNSAQMVHQANQAVLTGTKVKGVKGPSIMSILPYVNLVDFVFPEYMHSVLLGVVRQLLTLWFHKPGAWSCRVHIEAIDDFMNGIKTPTFIQRKPRSIESLKQWKASELYNWLLFFSIPVMKPYLPELYFQHYLLLVISIFSLVQDEIPDRSITEAEGLLQLFVQDMEVLYSDRQMTYNVHQLLHLASVVRKWGPLHLISAFPFENMNGIVSRTTHGTYNISKEIVNNIKIALGVQSLENKIKAKSNTQMQDSKGYFEVFGRALKPHTLTPPEINLLSSCGITDYNNNCYGKARVGKEFYKSNLYKYQKTANDCISWSCGNLIQYGSIRYFVISDSKLYLFVDKYFVNHVDVFFHADTRKTAVHVKPLQTKSESLILEADQKLLITKVLHVGNYICSRPNTMFQLM